MKINSLDIVAFGKFKNFHLDFSDGMTVFYGENEKGKSTVMAFIRMMFYGSTGKSSDIEKNPRLKYRPWNSDIMAGSISFTKNGKSYRLEREFKKTNSTDKITLIDLDLGTKQSLSGSDDIGAKIFGLSDAAFEKSVFVGELGAPAKNDAADGEINSKLSSLSVSGDEDVSFEKVSLRLTKAKEALMSKRGKIGKYDKTVSEIERLSSAIEAALDTEEQIAELQKTAELKKEELAQSSAEASRLFDSLKNADKIKKRRFVEQYLETAMALSEAEDKLRLNDGSILNREFVTDIKERLNAVSNLSEKLSTLENELTAINSHIEALSSSACDKAETTGETTKIKNRLSQIDFEIEEATAKVNQAKAEIDAMRPESKTNLSFVISGGALALIGAVATLISLYFGATLLAIGIILVALGFVFKKKVKPDDTVLKEEANRFSSEISKLLEEKQRLLIDYSSAEQKQTDAALKLASAKALIQSKAAEREERLKAVSDLTKQKSAKTKEILALCSKKQSISSLEEAKEFIEKIEATLAFTDSIKPRLSLLSDNSGCENIEQAEEKLATLDAQGISSADLKADTLKEEFKAQSDISSKIRSQLSALEAQIKALANGNPSAEILLKQKAELQQKAEEYKAFCETADIASEALGDAFRELRKNYSGALNTRTAEIFSKLTGDKRQAVNISKNFDISISTEDAFGLKEAAFLSSGTEDQLYLALRLSLAELMTEQTGSLPIILDDALTQYDDTRAKAALEFLKQYSANRQVLLYTCHSYFKEFAEALSINTIDL